MKTVTPALSAHLQLPVTTLAILWRAIRKDGAVFGFTTHDADIVYPPNQTVFDLFQRANGVLGANWTTIVGRQPDLIGPNGNQSDFTTPADVCSPTIPASGPFGQNSGSIYTGSNFAWQPWSGQIASATFWCVGAPTASLYVRSDGQDPATIGNCYALTITAPALLSACHIDLIEYVNGAAKVLQTRGLTSAEQSALLPGNGGLSISLQAFGSTITAMVGTSLAFGSSIVNNDIPYDTEPGAPGIAFDNVTWFAGQTYANNFAATALGATYLADAGLLPTAIENKSDMSVDNLEVSAFLDSETITEDDIHAGKWDFAEIEQYLVNWVDLSMGDLKLRKGITGNVQLNTPATGQFTAELRGLTQILSTIIGNLYGPECRADLGDAQCTINLAALTQTGSVTAATSSTAMKVTGISGIGDNAQGLGGFFDDGVITFTSGPNVNLSVQVKNWGGVSSLGGNDTLSLFLPLFFPPNIGDTFTITPGCDFSRNTCFTKFNNILNFRGEPDIPGTDALITYPDAPPAG